MTPAIVAAVLLALALLLSSLRLAARVRAKTLPASGGGLRLVAQVLVAALLWFALFPPASTEPVAALVVVTPGATELAEREPADTWVALPGTNTDAGIQAVPDLGTALRRHPGRSPVRVIGHGLPARDQDVAAGLPLVFEAATLPNGLQQLEAPRSAVQGQAFDVRGRVQGFAGGTVELLEASGTVLGSATLDEVGDFALTGRAGLAGATHYRLRWHDADDEPGGEEGLDVDVLAPSQPRLLLLSGGPSPELKYLRRWAVDAGLTQHSVIELGGGVQLGDRPLPINAATLAEFDLVVLDERAWRQLGPAGREHLRAAVREGLGVLVRITGELSAADRQALGAWGLDLEDSDAVRSLAWPGAERADPLPALAGIAGNPRPAGTGAATVSDDSLPVVSAAAGAADPAPLLSRRPLHLSASDGRALLVAPDGEALVAWRNEGRGRIGASILSDSHRLWLSGRRAAYGQLWADTVQTLARAKDDAPVPAPAPAWLGERTVLCGLSAGDAVTAPDGSVTALAIDPATGGAACAGYWPVQAGIHSLQRGEHTLPMLVRDPAAYPAMHAAQRQAATLALAAQASTAEATPQPTPGPRWPWWLAWLLASAALWWFERRPPSASL